MLMLERQKQLEAQEFLNLSRVTYFNARRRHKKKQNPCLALSKHRDEKWCAKLKLHRVAAMATMLTSLCPHVR